MEHKNSHIFWFVKYSQPIVDCCFCSRNKCCNICLLFHSFCFSSCNSFYLDLVRKKIKLIIKYLGLCYKKCFCLLFRMGNRCNQFKFGHGYSLLVGSIKINSIDNILDYGTFMCIRGIFL